MKKQLFISSLAILMSITAFAFDDSTSYVADATLKFKDGGRSALALDSHLQREGQIVVTSYDKQLNKREVSFPVIVRSRAIGLIALGGQDVQLALLNVQGKAVRDIMGEYRGVNAKLGFTSQLGYSIHANSNGVVLSNFASFYNEALGIDVSGEKLIIARPSESSNLEIKVSEQGKNSDSMTTITAEEAQNLRL